MGLSTRFTAGRALSRLAAAAALAVLASSSMAQAVKDPYLDFEGGPLWLPDGAFSPAPALGAATAGSMFAPLSGPSSVGLSFMGVSQFDLRNLLGGGSYIPPDTMGAIGATQYMETSNGVYGIYNKSTGALQSMVRADTFWANAGATGGLNGDARVMFDAPSQKWIAIQFGASVSDIQIAVSTTSDAAGAWRSTKFTGFAGDPTFGGVADYPTLAIDSQGVYIGTNNFTCTNASCSTANFSGTTLNVISRADLLGAAAPSVTSLKQFVTPSTTDRGFAIQGVNSTGATAGRVITGSLFTNDTLRYNVINPGTAGATLSAVTPLGTANYDANNPGGQQPDNTRNIDTLDQRISASAWEKNGKIYSVYTATPVGGTHTEVRFLVTDANTNAIIQQGSISDPNYDFYEGSLSVNDAGQVVIGYNRSGLAAGVGNVSVMARTFNTDGTGQLVQTNELLLHVSTVSDYHNGSAQGAAATGRQRWGDYSSVTVDPNNPQNFWVIGEYAAPWNNVAGCTPASTPGCTQTGGSTWGTWIAEVTVAAVPEASTYSMLVIGLLGIGAVTRRRAATA